MDVDGPHPEWHEHPVVRSYAVERGGVLVLIDPSEPVPANPVPDTQTSS